MENKNITQSKTKKFNICNKNKKFRNLNYRCSHQFAINNLLLKCEFYKPNNDKRNAILEVKNSKNGEFIRKHV